MLLLLLFELVFRLHLTRLHNNNTNIIQQIHLFDNEEVHLRIQYIKCISQVQRITRRMLHTTSSSPELYAIMRLLTNVTWLTLSAHSTEDVFQICNVSLYKNKSF